MVLSIDWKGKIGYGDIVSPICYAHNISNKLQTKVKLNFLWDRGINDRIERTDPETLWQRANLIHMMCVKDNTQVDVFHHFNKTMEENHTNYDWDIVGSDPFHNYWMPRNKWKRTRNTIVVNSTTKNKLSLMDYGKAWKDPVNKSWQQVVNQLSEHFNIVEVNYSTEIDTLVRELSDAVGFIGYHGTAAWVAKFLHTPSLIFSQNKSLTWGSFPYAVCESDVTKLDKWMIFIKNSFEMSEARAIDFEKKYQEYMPTQKHIESLHYEETASAL